jgi:hypothetical protein
VRASVVAVPSAALAAATPPPTGDGLTRGSLAAGRVAVPRGGGVMARTLPAPGVPGDGIYLVTDDGVKYPVADASAAEALGYDLAAAAAVPAALLATLPTGPRLHVLTGGDA